MLHESDDLLMDVNGSDSGFRGNDNDSVNYSEGGDVGVIEIDDTIIVSNKISLKSMSAINEFKVGPNDHFCHDTAIQSTITSSSPNVKVTEREHFSSSLLPQELHSPHKTPQKEQTHKYNPAIHSSPLHHNHNHHQQQPLQPLQSQPQLQRNLSESDMKKMRRMRWAAPMLPERSTKPLTIPVEFNLSKPHSRKTAPVQPQAAPKPLVAEPKNRRTPTIPVGPTLSYRPRRKNAIFDSSFQRPQQPQPQQQQQRKLGPTVPVPFNFSSSRSRSNNASQDTINEGNTNGKSSDSLSKMVMGDKFFSFKRSF